MDKQQLEHYIELGKTDINFVPFTLFTPEERKEFILRLASDIQDINFWKLIPDDMMLDPEIFMLGPRFNQWSLKCADLSIKTQELQEAALYEDLDNMQYVSEDLLHNRAWVELHLVKLDGSIFRFVADIYNNDEDLMTLASETYGDILFHVDERYRDHKDIALNSIKNNGDIYHLLSKRLKEDNDIIQSLLHESEQGYRAVPHMPTQFLNQRDLMLEFLEKSYTIFQYLPLKFRNDTEFAYKAYQKSEASTQYWGDELIGKMTSFSIAGKTLAPKFLKTGKEQGVLDFLDKYMFQEKLEQSLSHKNEIFQKHKKFKL